MLVSHRHRFIYLKTRKTGGTSTEMALEPFCRVDAAAPVSERTDTVVSEAGVVGARLLGRESHTREFRNHMAAAQIRAALGEPTWSSYVKIANIRNPWDKMLSSFFWRQRDKGVLDDPLPVQIARFRKLLRDDKIGDSGWYLCAIGDEIVADKVIRYSRLADDLAAVGAILGLPALDLPRAKTGLRPPDATSEAFYDAESRALLAARCAREIEVLGWVFGDPDPRHVAGTALDPTAAFSAA